MAVFLLKLLARLPLSILYILALPLYGLIYYLIRYRRETVKANLRGCFPNQSDQQRLHLEKQFYRQASDVLMEVIKSPTLSADEYRRRIILNNLELPLQYKEQQQPFVLLTSHQCNWEWLLHALTLQLELPVDAVYKPLHNQRIDDYMLAARSRFGAHPIPKNDILKEVMARRGNMHALAMVADQAPTIDKEIHWASFLGRETAFQVGAQRLPQMLKYPVLFVGLHRVKKGYYRGQFELLAEPPYSKHGFAILDAYIKQAETVIKTNPSDWLWTNRRWKLKRSLYR